MRTVAIPLIAYILFAGAVASAQVADPDWPCVQAKVPELSIGQMWSGPAPESNWRDDPATAKLAATIAARRTTLEEVSAIVRDYAGRLDADGRAEKLAELFAAVLHRIGSERGQTIAGIGRYAHKQDDLSRRIGAKEDDLHALEAAASPDMDKVEELQDTLAWDVRVFRERAQSLRYVCETPVVLERRAFAIGRILAGEI